MAWRALFASTTAVATLLSGHAAHAHTPGPQADVFGLPLEQLLRMRVTAEARKRPENVQDIPVSVTVLSGDQLEQRQIDMVSGLGPHTPSLSSSYSSGYAGNPRLFLRGLGQNETAMPTAESAVGIYLDDVYLARINASNLFLADVERVEVLRGPQGVLYGRNSSTGAIKIFSRPATSTASLALRARGGWPQQQDYLAVLNGPLGQQGLKARAALLYSDRAGETRRLNADGDVLARDLGDRRHAGGRLSLSQDLSSTARLDLQLYRFEERSDALYATPLDSDGRVLGGGDLHSTLSRLEQRSIADQSGASLRASWHSRWGEWKSVSAWRKLQDQQFNDISGQDIWYIDGLIDAEQISQEFQLSQTSNDSPLDWALGLYLLQEDNRADVFNDINQGSLSSRQIYDLRTRSMALYATLNYQLRSHTELSLGGRLTRDSKDFAGATRNTGGLWQDGEARLRRQFSNFSPTLALSHQLNPQALIYLSAAQGFKAGGFQGRAFNADDLQKAFGPETVWSYELGYKTSLIERRLQLNFAYFYNDYRDLQLNTLNAESGGTIIQNAGEARLHGLELELSYLTRFGLSIYAHAVAAWDRYESLADDISAVSLDSDFPETPSGAGLLGFDYEYQLRSNALLSLGLNLQYRASAQPGDANAAAIRVPGYSLLDGYLRWHSAERDWSVTLAGKNLSDRSYHYTGFSLPAFQAVLPAPRRSLRLSIGFNLP